MFAWTKKKPRKRPTYRPPPTEVSDTDSASESEIHTLTQHRLNDTQTSVSVQVSTPIPCNHAFGIEQLIEKSKTRKKLFQVYTGWPNYQKFKEMLKVILPDFNRKHIRYYDSRCKDIIALFDSDSAGEGSESDEEYMKRKHIHSLSVEDEFLLTLMKLRLGLINTVLATMFDISPSSVSRIIITWLNYMYLRLGSLQIWPHRDVIIENMPEEFKTKYGKTVVIIDCLELKTQMPSSRVRQSQTYSNYKSCNTFKCLVGVDSKGGIMFVSGLYTGNISDQQMCERSGFFEVLKRKLESGDILPGDGIMADKGFAIEEKLNEMGLELNIPPFLGNKGRFNAEEVIRTQTIAHHRIHVERAIGKVRKFSIFEKRLPLKLAGTVNQIWTVCTLLSNYQDPIL